MRATQSNRTARLQATLLGAILAAHALLLVLCAVNKSACFDEGAHLAAGLAYLKHGEMSIYNLSPPLLRDIAALPAYLMGADVPPAKRFRQDSASSRHWNYFDQWQSTNVGQVHRYILAGRFALMPLSLLAAVLVFAWASRLFGRAGGLIGCAAWCFSPTVIAQGSTLGTDTGCAAAMLLAAWLWQRFLEQPTPRRIVLAAGAVALAPATKFVGLLIFPILVVMTAVHVLRTRGSIRPALVGLAMSCIFSFVVINAVYGFWLMGDTLGSFRFRSHTMSAVQSALPGWLPLPFHRYLIEGFDAQKWEAEGVQVTVLFDEAYFGSDWRFYPVQFAQKEPLGGLALLGLALLSMLWRRPGGDEWPVIAAWTTFIAGMILLANINIWLRYLLPAYALGAIVIGRLATLPRLRIPVSLAVAGMVLETTLATPRFHSFCDVAFRRQRMAISDMDWGQGLVGLHRWMQQNHLTKIKLLYGGRVNPSEYGIESVDSQSPERTEYVAISRSMLLGVPQRLREGFVFVRPWRQLRATTPEAELDGMNVYRTDRVESIAPGPWAIAIGSWDQAIAEPTLIRLRNYTQRVSQDR